MTTDHDGTSVDDVLIAALGAGHSYQETAEIARCSKSTVARRMTTASFRAEVAAAREEYVEMMRGRVMQAQPSAVTVLADLMMTATSDADRIRAARALLEVRRRDPFVDEGEFARVVRRIVDVAMTHVPEENQAAFIAEVRAIA
jgi:hypothetical protein